MWSCLTALWGCEKRSYLVLSGIKHQRGGVRRAHLSDPTVLAYHTVKKGIHYHAEWWILPSHTHTLSLCLSHVCTHTPWSLHHSGIGCCGAESHPWVRRWVTTSSGLHRLRKSMKSLQAETTASLLPPRLIPKPVWLFKAFSIIIHQTSQPLERTERFSFTIRLPPLLFLFVHPSLFFLIV